MNQKNILVTGPNSFVGKNLIKELKKKYKVFTLSIKSKELKISGKKSIKIKKFKSINKDELLYETRNINFFSLIHCHAYGTVGKINNEKEILRYNLFIGLEILKFIKCFLVFCKSNLVYIGCRIL